MRPRGFIIWTLAVILPAVVLVGLRVGTERTSALFAAEIATITFLLGWQEANRQIDWCPSGAFTAAARGVKGVTIGA
jgi:hypothetical protein